MICGYFNSRVGRNLDYIEGVDKNQNTNLTSDTTNKRKRYKLNSVPTDFLNNDEIRDQLNDTIFQIENSIRLTGNIQHAYDKFQTFSHSEMDTSFLFIR